MDIEKFTIKCKERAQKRTQAEGIVMLKKVGIIDNDGYLSPNYYSPEAVKKDRDSRNPIK